MLAFSDIERYAFAKRDLPSEANSFERAAYLAMCHLYALYDTGQISQKDAARQKGDICRSYGTDELKYQYYDMAISRYRAIQPMLSTVEKEAGEDETIRKIVRILDGREKI